MFAALQKQAAKILQREFALQNFSVQFSVPGESSHGDAVTTVALELAKTLHRKPQDIANVLRGHLLTCEGIAACEVAGAGYVNVWLTPAALLHELAQAREASTARVIDLKARPIIIEYSQPNIAKPLGVHHLLSTVIGQVLTNLSKHLGERTIAINHIGDFGTQFGKLAVAHAKWGEKEVSACSLDDLLALYVRFHEEAVKDANLENQGREAFCKLEQGDPALHAFWKAVVDITMRAMEKIYARLSVSFDFVQGESFYKDKMQSIIDEGKVKNVFIQGEKGALIAAFSEESKLPPAVVLKGDGATLYHTRDLATIRYRIDTWKPAEILYVVDVAQKLYFEQLFAMVQLLGWELPHLEHVVFGRMRFSDKSMSTRKGNILKLEEVLDEAVRRAEKIIEERGDTIQTDDPEDLAEMMGIGAVVFGILSQNRKQGIVFDWDKMLSFEGMSAPYLQYTHARARSVLRKAGAPSVAKLPMTSERFTDKERSLILSLLLFSRVLADARTSLMPHKIAQYLFGLCQQFNAFYNTDPILKAEDSERILRLTLTAMTADVLHTGARILTLRLPDRM